MKYQAPRGTEDILPEESAQWQWLEGVFRSVCRLYGYKEIRTPTFEDTDLFVRGLGETSDAVNKEMYTFIDRGGRSITLKPEATAPVARAYVEHSLGHSGQISRLYYITPIYRYERPQKGRLRQSHQTGVELLGSSAPDADAEIIDLTVRFYKTLGLNEVNIKLNSLGMNECRAKYREALLNYSKNFIKDYPEDFRERCEKNPLRLLDSKDEKLKAFMMEAPLISDYFEHETKEHFGKLQELLIKLEIDFHLDARLVRGLDYYTKTVFEVQSKSLGAQNALCGGGRYDDLIEKCGGHPTPAVGVAMGIERALMVLRTSIDLSSFTETPLAFAVCLTDNRAEFWKIIQSLRDENLSIECDTESRSAKSQFRQADKSGAKFAIIIGDDELKNNQVKLKNLATGEETIEDKKIIKKKVQLS